MTLLAQSDPGTGVGDNAILDEWTIPFGQWIDQMVDWIAQNLSWLLNIVEWPFRLLFRNFVNGAGHNPWWEISDMPWIGVCVLFFVLGTLFRNARVGVTVGLLLAGCGLLGIEYWKETAVTLGMIIVAVVLCVIIGIPVGVLCGRVDGAWRAVRPVLDAMQVVHPFVYMLPVIFFFGIGQESATMVTMVFALPPLIRLTNLGIRQVPADVVEASRAYGAPEWRVLRDVQLPLARPAIMTGVNQTLLLSISMLGIAAIMGAGGLGLLVFRGVQNLDTALSASAGLALFIVAVVLDRISQTDEDEGANIITRIWRAWTHLREPEELVPTPAKVEAMATMQGRPAPVTPVERRGTLLALVGAALCVVAPFLTWASDSSVISGYGRSTDQDLAGQSFNGIAAEGGSIYGVLILIAGLLLVAGAVITLRWPDRQGRVFGADGAVIISLGALVTAIAYLWAAPPEGNAAYSDGIGAWLALVGGVVAVGGSLLWLRGAPYSPRRPLRTGISTPRLGVVVLVALIAVAAGFSGWSFDQRAETVITPELEAEIEALEAEAEGDPAKEAAVASEIAALINRAQRLDKIVLDGFSGSGAGLGWPTLLIAAVGLLAALPAVGVFGDDERRKWRWSVVAAGLGAGMALVGITWIGTLLRTAEPKFTSGAGAFLTVLAGLLLMATTRNVLREFHRSEVYVEIDEPGSAAGDPAGDPGPAGARSHPVTA